MKVYLVGGAVRNSLMNKPVKERDWVVLDSTPEEMINQGYLPIGKDFPVFLHPKTKEEYALARTERKIARGYKGFNYYCGPNVTLEDDLKRRDLTINAMTKDDEGKIIDPFNGQKDLQNKVLRHVSDAFSEDPVRLLRVARFAACFGDFTVHPDTQALMSDMVKAGEVDALVPERVWRELAQALETKAPWRFFEIIEQCKAAPIIWPELDLNAFDFTAIKRAARLSPKGHIRLAALLHRQSAKAIRQLTTHLRAPKPYKDLLTLVIRHGNSAKSSTQATPEQLLKMLEHLDAFRRPNRFKNCLIVIEASLEDETEATKCRKHLYQAYQKAATILPLPFLKQGYQGLALKKRLDQARITALKSLSPKA